MSEVWLSRPTMKRLCLVLVLLCSSRLAADTIVNPIDDGSIYGLAPSPNSVSHGAYVLTSGYIRGAMLFQAFDSTVNEKFYLTVNPYGLPVWDLTVDVYGYGSTSSSILGTDYDLGQFLGTLNIPASIGYGQDTRLDVTAFLRSANSPYYGFILRTNSGTDVFSSLEYNYGHPSRLVGVPDSAPGATCLGILSVFGAVLVSRRRQRG